ncbi:hypothetical protein FDP41_004779 [Naegleria fowleri]|uniref:Uncharacterized protein n=1 Tax=Naegleria fowleri TaxID=5763 RepID=A0A6A5BPS0_NAEFO|nr:uncharacterized protein FDP41_004779 [Naegleria fowleri]KAF0976104.1 hypothetical protein FDP41_004779 [Naegleria fowleri]CAG4712305.1 unnamed protein product [Naegleria fowleri]
MTGFSVDHIATGHAWTEGSGKTWKQTQTGAATFQWVQDGTGRVAHGVAVQSKKDKQWHVHITFDGNTHWKLTPSADGNQLQGPSDTFTLHSSGAKSTFEKKDKIKPKLEGADYTENSGAVWHVTHHKGGKFEMTNQRDQRVCHGTVGKDQQKNHFVVYLEFPGNVTMRVETADLATLNLPNGDVFRRTSEGKKKDKKEKKDKH